MSLRPWQNITVLLDNKYSSTETITELSNELKNVEFLTGENDESAPLGLSETEVHKVYNQEYEWTSFDGTKLTGFLMVYYRK